MSQTLVLERALAGDLQLEAPVSIPCDFASQGLLQHGKPRLGAARTWFLNLNGCNVAGLVDYYKKWRDYDEFLVLHKAETDFREKAKTIAVKCSKRGNDVYARRTKKKLGFLKAVENKKFFSLKDFDCETPVYTSLLWVSLTWDSNFSSLEDSWIYGQYYYNKWITNLRNHYGAIDVLRFPQAFPDSTGKSYAYQHFHCVLLFKDARFKVFPFMNDKGELSYRIEEKDEFNIQGKWHSWTDIKAISSMLGIYRYAIKHYENAGFGSSDEAALNNAMCWVFKKKSYTVSAGFRVSYSEFITSLRNSKTHFVQIDLFGVAFKESWVFIGIKSSSELAIEYPDLNFSRSWFVDLPFCAWNPRECYDN